MRYRLRSILPGSLLFVSSLVNANNITLTNATIDEGEPAGTVLGHLQAPTIPKAIKIDNYLDASAVVLEDGSLWVWGQNGEGQLGNGTTVHINTPFQLVPSGVVDVAMGVNYLTYLKTDGSLWAVGKNDVGQLGNGSYIDTTSPVQVMAPGAGITAIAAGDRHHMVLKDDGSLWVTGVNFDGQVGDNTKNNQPAYVQVVASGVAQIAAGWAHSMYIGTDGSLWLWGVNDRGAIGTGSFDVNDTVAPLKIVDSGVVQAVGGHQSTYFIKTDGSLWGMGYNVAGQIGDGTSNDRATPFQIESSGITNVEAGDTYVLYEKADGTIWGLGDNYQGRMGTSSGFQFSPIYFGISDVKEIRAYRQTLIIDNDDSVFIMGTNNSSALGDGDTSSERNAPYYHFLGGTFALVAGEGDTNNADFNIEGYKLVTNSSLGGGSYSVRVQANPTSGNPVEEILSIVVDSPNPPVITAPATASGDEEGTIAFASPGGVTTLAGGHLDLSFADGPGEDARFHWSYDLVPDSLGNIYVADRQNNRVRKISTDGTVSTFAGNGTASSVDGTGTSATFKSPMGMAVDNEDNIYTISLSSKKVRKITPAGVVTTIAGSGAQGNTDGSATSAKFHLPYDIAYDSTYHLLYVADNSGDRIRKIDLNLDPTNSSFVTTLAGGTGGYQDGTGSGARFESPGTLDVDSLGNVYVGDVANYRIRKITPAGVVTTIAGNGQTTSVDGEGTNASFGKPRGIMVFDDNTLYVSDENNYIRKIELDKNNLVTTLVGTGTAGNQDGPLASATLNTPVGIHRYGDDIIYCSQNASVVRLVELGSSLSVSDEDGGALTASFSVNHGILTVTPSGSATITDGANSTDALSVQGSVEDVNATLATLEYQGLEDFHGTDTLTYSVTDGANPTEDATVSITVSNVNDAPEISGLLAVSGSENSPIHFETVEEGTITTFAGSGVPATVDGIGLNAQFDQITDMIADTQGNLYTAGQGHYVRKITPEGVVSTFAGNGTSATQDGNGINAAINWPVAITVDDQDNLYVSEHLGHTIRKITPSGDVTTLAGIPGATGHNDGPGATALFNDPQGVVWNPFSNVLYVSDFGNHRIRVVDLNLDPSDANYVTTLAGSGVAEHVDGTETAAVLNAPFGGNFDSAGNFYFAEYDGRRIRKLTPSGEVTTVAGSGQDVTTDGFGEDASFTPLWDIFVYDDNTLLVLEDAGYIRKVELDKGNWVSTIAGNGTHGNNDGDFSVATLGRTSALVRVGDALFMGSYSHYNIRRIDFTKFSVFDPDGDTLTIDLSVDAGSLHVTPAGSAVISAGANDSASLSIQGSEADLQATLGTLEFTGDSDATLTYSATDGSETTTNQTTSIFVDPPDFGIGGIAVLSGDEDTSISFFKEGQVTTIAGNGTAGELNAIGTAAQFNSPHGLVADSNGNIFVVDFLNDLIRRIEPDGSVFSFAGNGVPTTINGNGLSAAFDRPTGISIDADDNLYVVEGNGTVVRKVTPSGDATVIAGVIYTPGNVDGPGATAKFGYPIDVVMDQAANVLYVSDYSNNSIRKVDLNLADTDQNFVTTLAGGSGANEGDEVIIDPSPFNQPYGLDIDSAGNLYLADRANNQIRKITPSGDVSTVAGTGVAGNENGSTVSAQFNGPTDVLVYNDQTLFVADRGGHLVRVIDLASNQVSTLFGDGSATQVDGGFDTATSHSPYMLAKYQENIYLTSFDGHTVRKIELDDQLHVYHLLDEILTVDLAVSNGTLSVTLAVGATISAGANDTESLSLQGSEEALNETLATLQYLGHENFSGNSTLTYSVTDGVDTSEEATLAITVNPVNDAPVAEALSSSTPRNTAININLVASDLDEDQLNFTVLTNPTKGTLSGTAPNLTYTPSSNFIGIDSFTYRVNDGITDSQTATASINVHHPIMNWVQWVAPSYANFNPDPAYTYATSTTGQVSLPDGSLLDVTFNGEIVKLGSAFGTTGNSFWVAKNYNGSTYLSTNAPELPTNSDRLGLSGSAVAVQNLTFSEPVTNLVMNIWSLGNPTVPGSYQFDQPFVVLSQSTQYSAFSINETTLTGLEGSGTIQFNGTITSLSWTVPAAEFYSNWNVGVTANPAPGEAASDITGDVSGSGEEDQPIAGTLAATDLQGLTDGTYFSISEAPANGSATINTETGAWVYTPGANYFGGDSFVVTVTDDLGSTTDQEISITVNSVNDAPVLAEIGPQGLSINTSKTLTILATDVDEDTLSLSAAGSTNLSATLSGNVLTISPNENWTGAESITVSVNDGNGGSDSEAFEVSVSTTPMITGLEDVSGDSGSSIPLTNEIPVVDVLSLIGTGSQGYADGTSELAQFSYPSAIAYDSAGNLFVADYDNNRIRKVAPDGTTSLVAGDGKAATTDGEGDAAQFNRPSGIAIDANDIFYVVEHAGHVIRKITPAGSVTTLAGAAGVSGNINGAGANARFDRPFGLAIHPSSPTLYISEWGNHSIRKIDLSLDPSEENFVSTLAGSGTSGFSDGTGAAAQFNYPYGVEVDASGNLYVADHWNHRIRKVTSAGVVSTVAGNGEKGSVDADGSSAQIGQPWAVTLQDEVTLLASTANRTLRSIDLSNDNQVTTLVDDSQDLGYSTPIGRVSSLVAVDGSIHLASLSSHNILSIEQGNSSLRVSDQDSDTLTVTLSVNYGVLSFAEGLVGSTTLIDGALNTSTITLEGPASDLNETLANLSYASNQGFFGTDSLTYTVSDGVTESTPATVSITVTPLEEIHF